MSIHPWNLLEIEKVCAESVLKTRPWQLLCGILRFNKHVHAQVVHTFFVKSLMPDDAIKHWQASCHHKRKACHFLNYSLWLPGYSVVPRMIDTHCAQGASHHYLPERNSCKIELAAMLIPAPCQKKSSDLALGGKLWDVHSAFPKHGPKNHAKHGCVQLRLQLLGSP